MEPNFLDRAKEGILMILIAAVFSMVPFYFQTSAATAQIQQTNALQDNELTDALTRVRQLEVNEAVNETETRQIKESLERIEKKIDKLIEERNE